MGPSNKFVKTAPFYLNVYKPYTLFSASKPLPYTPITEPTVINASESTLRTTLSTIAKSRLRHTTITILFACFEYQPIASITVAPRHASWLIASAIA